MDHHCIEMLAHVRACTRAIKLFLSHMFRKASLVAFLFIRQVLWHRTRASGKKWQYPSSLCSSTFSCSYQIYQDDLSCNLQMFILMQNKDVVPDTRSISFLFCYNLTSVSGTSMSIKIFKSFFFPWCDLLCHNIKILLKQNRWRMMLGNPKPLN